jgi:hypothetical protein
MSKPTTYTVKTTVTKNSKPSYNEYSVTLEGAGFVGEANGIFLGQVFEKAFEDLMAKVAEGIFPQTE